MNKQFNTNTMKTKNAMLTMCMMAVFMMASTMSFSQTTKPDKQVVKFKTNAHCGSCKNTMEQGLAYDKGIKDVSVDLDTKILTVVYNPKKTNEQNIKAKVNKLGYTADLVTEPCMGSGNKTGNGCVKSCPGHSQGCGKH
ncbi:MAG: heavy metal-associated domain-containing protein [Bacteroidales bacterium]|jgi:copper chaperone CopZ